MQIYTGKPPFAHIKVDVQLILEVVARKRKHPRPPHGQFPDDLLWELVSSCLSYAPEDRPSADEVLGKLQAIESPRHGLIEAEWEEERTCIPEGEFRMDVVSRQGAQLDSHEVVPEQVLSPATISDPARFSVSHLLSFPG